MRYITDKHLSDFEFWSGAKDFAAKFSWSQLDTIDKWLDELYANSEPMTDVEINDLFWFGQDEILHYLGFDEACTIILHGESQEDINAFIEWYKADEDNELEDFIGDKVYYLYHDAFKNQNNCKLI